MWLCNEECSNRRYLVCSVLQDLMCFGAFPSEAIWFDNVFAPAKVDGFRPALLLAPGRGTGYKNHPPPCSL